MTLRTLLASTALAGLLTTGALAQAADPAATNAAPAAAAPATTTSAEPMQSANAGDYVPKLETDQYLASDLTGQDVYETNAPDAREVGEIENFVVGKDGKVAAVVIETSGLDQNKTIAAPADKIEWAQGQNGDMRAVLKAAMTELQAAPEFIARAPRDAAANGAMVPGTGAAATTGGAMAPGADTAMAPGGAMAPGNEMAAGGAMAPGGAMATGGAMAPAPSSSDATAMTSSGQANGAATRAADAAGATTPAVVPPTPAPAGYLAALGNDQRLSEDVIGSNVYSGPGDDAETIGSVNDLVVTKMGDVPAAVIGVGGFLGIGEKNVGVPFAKIQMLTAGNSGEPRLVLAATKDQLKAAPTFDEGSRRSTTAANTPTGGAGMAGGMAAGGMAAGGMAANDPMQQQGTVAPGSTLDGNTMAANGVTTPNGGAMAGADTSTTSSTSADARSQMQPVSGPELTADRLSGVSVYGPNDRSIGSVSDIALTADGKVDAIIVDVGGFLGIGSKPVAVAMDNLQFLRDTNGTVNVYTQFTEDQLKNAPAFNRDTYAQNRDQMRITQGNAPAKAQQAQ